MKSKTKGITFIIVGLALWVGTGILMENMEEYQTDLPCYDAEGNMIQGLTCKGEVMGEHSQWLLVPTLIGLVFSISGIIIFLFEGYGE